MKYPDNILVIYPVHMVFDYKPQNERVKINVVCVLTWNSWILIHSAEVSTIEYLIGE